MDFILGVIFGSLFFSDSKNKQSEIKKEDLLFGLFFIVISIIVIFGYVFFPYKETLQNISSYIIIEIANLQEIEIPVTSYSFLNIWKDFFSFFLYMNILYVVLLIIRLILYFLKTIFKLSQSAFTI